MFKVIYTERTGQLPVLRFLTRCLIVGPLPHSTSRRTAGPRAGAGGANATWRTHDAVSTGRLASRSNPQGLRRRRSEPRERQTGARRRRRMVLHLQTFVEIVTQDTLNVVHACVPSSGTHTQTHTHVQARQTPRQLQRQQ